jgi:class 3 adenylate cyclase
MAVSLLFLPDISGYTQFVQSTEIEHSQHVIAELLEVLIKANTYGMELAEIEGDALFFYLDAKVLPPLDMSHLVEQMFTAFHSHLALLQRNRICPCNACKKAPDLKLKIIAHAGSLEFLDIRGNHKPFGPAVIEAHRLMKNSVPHDSYVLVSDALGKAMGPTINNTELFSFASGKDVYDGVPIGYTYTFIDAKKLNLYPHELPKFMAFDRNADHVLHQDFPVSANTLLELLTNYRFRDEWLIGVDEFRYTDTEVTRLGTEHVCVINGKHLNFVTVSKEAPEGVLVYGEETHDTPVVDTLWQFYLIRAADAHSCTLTLELFWEVRNWGKRLLFNLVLKRLFKANAKKALAGLLYFAEGYNDLE